MEYYIHQSLLNLQGITLLAHLAMDSVHEFMQSVQWNATLLKDDNFLDPDALQSSSFFYKQMYDDVSVSETIHPDFEEDLRDSKNQSEKKRKLAPKVEKVVEKVELQYIPGLKRVPLLHIKSKLSVQEQAHYLLQYCVSDTLRFPEKLMERETIVLAEQKVFVEFCLKQALQFPLPYNNMMEQSREYIEEVLKKNQSCVKDVYPKKYSMVLQLPLSHPSTLHPVHLLPVKELMSLGTVYPFDSSFMYKSKVILPSKLNILDKYFTTPNPNDGYLHQTPVSKDTNAIQLAHQVGADVVASSKVLITLINCHPNHPQNCAPTRDIPILVTTMPGNEAKKIVYIDSPLPPTNMNTHMKKMWFCKRASRVLFCKRDAKYLDLSDGKEVIIPKESNEPLSYQDELKQYQEGRSNNVNAPPEGLGECSQESVNKTGGTLAPKQPAPHHNMVYGQWSLKYQDCEKLAAKDKRGTAEVMLVVRTSYHGYEKKDEHITLSRLSMKLEYQPHFGAQVCTVGELSEEWMALQLRPNSIIHRVRVDADTEEIIQVQQVTLPSVMMEARQRNLNPTHCLGALHHVLRQLTSLQPNNYILRIQPQKGQAELLRATDNLKNHGKIALDLTELYGVNKKQNSASIVCPYSPIDPRIITPWQQYLKRVPATFTPVYEKTYMMKSHQKKARKGKHPMAKQVST